MKVPTEQRKIITKFIQSINEKDFAGANEQLKLAINEKIKSRIKVAGTKPLFEK